MPGRRLSSDPTSSRRCAVGIMTVGLAALVAMFLGSSAAKGKPLSALVKAIQDGDAYVNIHTAEHKAGEIRGQIK